GIVFAITFLVVQFSAMAYSPRVVLLFADSRATYHALGIFFATFIYALAALVWTDRESAGRVPLLSIYVVGSLLIVSVVVFAWLIRSVSNLQIQYVLRTIGAHG